MTFVPKLGSHEYVVVSVTTTIWTYLYLFRKFQFRYIITLLVIYLTAMYQGRVPYALLFRNSVNQATVANVPILLSFASFRRLSWYLSAPVAKGRMFDLQLWQKLYRFINITSRSATGGITQLPSFCRVRFIIEWKQIFSQH